jgi:phospholipase C
VSGAGFAPGSSIKHPLEELDRWLLAALGRAEPVPAVDFAASESARRAGGEPALHPAQVEAWLRSAERRGLVVASAASDPRAAPDWSLTGAGRERIAAQRSLADRIPFAPLRRLAGKLLRLLPGHHHEWAELVAAIEEAEVHWNDAPQPPDPHPRRIAAAEESTDERGASRLLEERVQRIVVLMLENRSFDHMLGYLTLRGNSEVHGLDGRPEQSNLHAGRRYWPRHLANTRFPKSQDPCHSIKCVAEQIAADNGGFVANFAKVDPDHPDLVMGYYDGDQLPTYDYLAHSACICDHWHSSVPGSTWVNRLYAMCGTADPESEGMFDEPLWDFPSFPRHLDAAGVMWRWYSHDPGTLRVADSEYRTPDKWFHRDHFRFFDRRMVSGFTALAEELVVDEHSSFLDDARRGELPPVSWIDPNFIDLSFLERNSNDDHPPSDVRAAQELVLRTVRALAEGPEQQRLETLLLIVYDEHGGFYYHVVPPEAPHDPVVSRYGVRVPAFVVSPWVEPGTVSHTLFDHASIVKTILDRFAPGAAAEMGPRVANAEHLGRLLTRARPAPPGDYGAAVRTIAEWRAGAAHEKALSTPVPTLEQASRRKWCRRRRSCARRRSCRRRGPSVLIPSSDASDRRDRNREAGGRGGESRRGCGRWRGGRGRARTRRRGSRRARHRPSCRAPCRSRRRRAGPRATPWRAAPAGPKSAPRPRSRRAARSPSGRSRAPGRSRRRRGR